MLHRLSFRLLACLALAASISLPGFAAAQTLLSQGKPATSSSQEGNLAPGAAFDGNTGTRWASNYNNAEWIYVDLGTSSAISRVVLNWETAYGKAYQIQVSDDKTNWTTIYSTTTGDGGVDDFTLSGTGRYVRMNGITRGTGYGYSLWEFQVYGGPVVVNNLLPVLTTVASSQEGGLVAANATDGNTTTRWGSNFTNAEWIYVDLQTQSKITRVVLNWEAAFGKAYQIQTSNDKTNWTTVYSTTTGDGGIDDIAINDGAVGRYVRMNGITRGTGYGYSLWEFQVYGATNVVTSSSTATTSSKITSSTINSSAINSTVATSKSSSSSIKSIASTSSSSIRSTSKSSSTSSSVPCDIIPTAPTNLSAAGITSSSFVLAWKAPAAANCIATYVITQDGNKTINVSGSTTNTLITGLAASTSHTFTVTAVGFVGSGPASAPLTVSTLADSGAPNFGANTYIVDPSMNIADVQAKINSIYAIEQNNQFGTPRHAIMFKPGTYNVDIPVGFFTHVIGLGSVPDDVKVASVHSDAVLPNNNSTQNFWRSIENFAITPSGGGTKWAVSQAAPVRRMHIVNNNIMFSDNYGWASGGWMSDSKVDFDVNCWAQQQWISRNSQWGSWSGSLWNMVFVGIPNNLPGGTWPTSANTVVNATPVVREKPFLHVNGNSYEVFVPALKTNSSGISWASGIGAGTSLPISQFYLAHPESDTAATINAALNSGKHLLLTPGIYSLSEAIHVTHADTVILGMGFATLRPTNGNAVLSVDDVDGVKIAHLMIDADTKNSPVLVEVGDINSNASHVSNPTSLSDVFIRVGGNGAGKATVSMQINSNDVIIDHTWIWRADHGEGAGWYSNTTRNGLVVNGNNVTAYGLFVEHFQQYQVLWNGNNGRTYFYQSEIPYDPPTQAEFTSGAGMNGWASYKVADSVSNHEAWGLGIYAVFLQPNVNLSHAIEVPNTPNVKFHHMVTVNLTANGAIQNVINNTGGSTPPGVAVGTPRVTDYPAP